jgi:hypothetical protein
MPVVSVRCGDDVCASDAGARTPSATARVVTVRFLRVFATSILTSVLTYLSSCSTDMGFQAAESWIAMRLIAAKSPARSVRC